MKPDSYMPFYGSDFFAATVGFSRSEKCSYLSALWHYWSHSHCTGLPDDDQYLRTVCGCEVAEWARTRGMIFDNEHFFRMQDGKWHQRRAQEEFVKVNEAYQERVDRAEKLNQKRWGNDVDIKVDNDVDNVHVSKPEPEQDNTTKSSIKRFAPPSLDEVKLCAAKTGLSPQEAEKFFNYHTARGWMMGRNKMKSWPHALATWKINAQTYANNGKTNGQSIDRNAGTANEGRANEYDIDTNVAR